MSLIRLEEASPAWALRFVRAREELGRLFPGLSLEHVGSTAVPGLAARPILDLLLGLPSLEVVEARIPELEALGYRYVPDYEGALPRRRYFRREAGEGPTCHLHTAVKGSAFWEERLAFREALIPICHQ